MSRILGGASLVLLITTLLFWGLWQKSQVRVEALQGKVQTLTSAKDTQDITITGLQDLAAANAVTIATHGKQVEEATRETRALQTSLDELRFTEAESALAAPYARGNASYRRQCAALLRFSDADTGAHNPCDADTNNTPPSKSPGSG